jgi:phosphoglycerate dehydrogenase-like enzyme
MTRLLCPSPDGFSVRVRREAQRDLDARFVTMTQKEFERRAPGYDVVLIRFHTRVDDKVMGPASRLKAVLSPTTGLDHIDLDAAKRHGVRVFHLRDQRKLLKTVSATAELTVALMLALLRGLPGAIGSVRAHRWETARFRGAEAAGKTIGIVGYGRLGSKVSRVARAHGMNVIA